jgi:hypothetical protein
MTTNSVRQKACFDAIVSPEEWSGDGAQDEDDAQDEDTEVIAPAFAVVMKDKLWPNGKVQHPAILLPSPRSYLFSLPIEAGLLLPEITPGHFQSTKERGPCYQRMGELRQRRVHT